MSATSILVNFRGKGLSAVLCMVMMTSCYKEAPLTASPPNNLVLLPQGNHPYDQEILQFYNTYHSAILYTFDSSDFYYSFTGATNIYIDYYPADTNYIQSALNFLDSNWLNMYPTAFLQQTLPYKILLASALVNINSYYPQFRHPTAMAGFNNITFGLVTSSLPSLLTSQKDSARGQLNQVYWQQAIQNNMVEMPAGFDSLTSYTLVNAYNAAQNGIINVIIPGGGTFTAAVDLLQYIQLITSTSRTALNSTWLSPATDVNGMYNLKYNLIVNYYLTKYGVDLQAIGNLP